MNMEDNHVSQEYKTALRDLTFNSKPLINVLTMLAEENVNHGMDIVHVICDRIKQVDVDQKLTSLYLLDSILKNVGGDYVNYISRTIVDIFCHVFESAVDERKRMSLFKLRNTWTQYIPGKILYDLDMHSNKIDPNWPVNRLSETPNNSNQQQNKIHVNPKFLQKNERVTSGNQSTGLDRNGLDNSIVQSKTPKDRLMEEEQRVQEQLRALQAEKVKREREQHELMLRQKQIEREKMLSEQKRQLELLRKQQQSMISSTKNNKTQISNPIASKKEPNKDPRLRVTPPNSQEISTGKWGEKVTPPNQTHPSSSLKPSPKPMNKKKKGAVSVMNKIMTNLATTKGKSTGNTDKTSKLSQLHDPSAIENVNKLEASKNEKNSEFYKNKDKTEGHKNKGKTEKASNEPTVEKKEGSIETPVTSSASPVSSTTVGAETSNSNPVASTVPPLPFSSAFTGLSSRDMQIAAQAAAIATAMHQMQTATQGTLAPEQSAQLAAQFIQIMQGASSMVNVTSTTLSAPAVLTTTTAASTVSSTVTSSTVATTTPTVSTTITQASTSPASTSPASTSPPSTEARTTKQTNSPTPVTTSSQMKHNEKNSARESPVIFDNNENQSSTEKMKEPSKNKQNKVKKETKDNIQTVEKVKKETKDNIQTAEVKSERIGREKIKIEDKKEDKIRDRSPHDSKSKNEEPKKPVVTETESAQNNKNNKVRGRDWAKKDIEKLEPPSKKLKDTSDPNERPRKARARSPSRYYCRMEQKMETDKRVEEKEKEMKLQRIRKLSDSVDCKDANSNQTKIYQQYVNHISELEKRHAKPNSTIKLTTLDSVFKQIQSKFKTGLLSITQNKKLMHLLDTFATQLAGEEVKMIDRALGIQSTKGLKKLKETHTTERNKGKDGNSPIPQNEKLSTNHPKKDNTANTDPRLRRSVPDDQNNSTSSHPGDVLRDGPPFRDDPRLRDDLPPDMRDMPPPHMRDMGPPRMRGVPPPYMRDGPSRFMRDGPRDGPRPNMRGGPMRHRHPRYMHRDGPLPPPHMMDGAPHHMRDGPPPHMMDGPPQHMRDGPPPHMMDGGPHHMRDGPPPHMMDGPPHHMRDGPPPHMMDGAPHHMRDGPPPHMRDGPPQHMQEGPRPHVMDGPQHHMRDGPPQHMRDGPPPHHIREGPPKHTIDGPQKFIDGPPHSQVPMRNTPPPHMIENIGGEGGFREGFQPQPPERFNENSSDGSNLFNPGPSLDVNNLLGQLMAAGMIKKEEPVDMTVPEMPLKIDSLKKRHQSVVHQLFLGMQCSSCGERFPDTHKQQYSDHLDWHFRENRREKDGVRKVASRSWYHDLDDWIEHFETKLREDGKVQSEFFESEKTDKPIVEDSASFSSDKKKDGEDDQSVPVSGDEGNGLCGVCNDQLEQYWDEDLEEWRFKQALREGDRTYHIDCFKDYVPYEAEEATTPSVPTTPVTPGDEEQKSFELEQAKEQQQLQLENLTTEIKTEEEQSETVSNEAPHISHSSEESDTIPKNVQHQIDTAVDVKKEEIEDEVKNTPKVESSNSVDLDNNRTKDVQLDDEYIGKADSPEYPVIKNNSETNTPVVTPDAETPTN